MGTLTAGIKEIFSSAKTTGSNVMLCGNDGTPDGHITMANLANVLGVVFGRHYASSEVVDFNDLCPDGDKIKIDASGSSDNKQHAPADGWGNLLSISSSSGQKSQLYINSQELQYRHKDGSGDWSKWKKLTVTTNS